MTVSLLVQQEQLVHLELVNVSKAFVNVSMEEIAHEKVESQYILTTIVISRI